MTPGGIRGLPQRMAEWLSLANTPGTAWLGQGRHKDLELIVRLLSLNEFGQFLRTHSDAELAQWGLEVLEAAEAADELEALQDDIDQALPNAPTYHGAVVIAGETISSVRAVLVHAGALAEDDTETPIAGLVAALLS